MTLDDVLKYYGTGYKMSKMTNLSASNIIHWKKLGYIPIVTQMRIEKLSQGDLKANFNDCPK
jgi:hypothetical protein